MQSSLTTLMILAISCVNERKPRKKTQKDTYCPPKNHTTLKPLLPPQLLEVPS